ncbi:hypothetical protein SpCBS45565_g01653 [Spizellomyces sp. 'palustris']|nr:hypothetical protein SpCBS45565_g01653 [Spizellomyces sp. 'palustris']
MRLLARWFFLWLVLALLAETVSANHRRNKNLNNNNFTNKKQTSSVQRATTAVVAAATQAPAQVTVIYVITSALPDPPSGLPTDPPSQSDATRIESQNPPGITPLMATQSTRDGEPPLRQSRIGEQSNPPPRPTATMTEIINNKKVAAVPDKSNIVNKGTATSTSSSKVGPAVVVFMVVAGAGLLVAVMGIYTFRKVGLAQSQGFKDRLKRRLTYAGQGDRARTRGYEDHPNGTMRRMFDEYDDGTMMRGTLDHGTIRSQGTMRSIGTLPSHGIMPSLSYPPNVEYMGQPSDLDYVQPPHGYRYDQNMPAPAHLQHTSREKPHKYRYEGSLGRSDR